MALSAGKDPDHARDQHDADHRTADHDPPSYNALPLPALRPDPCRGMLAVIIPIFSLSVCVSLFHIFSTFRKIRIVFHAYVNIVTGSASNDAEP